MVRFLDPDLTSATMTQFAINFTIQFRHHLLEAEWLNHSEFVALACPPAPSHRGFRVDSAGYSMV